MSMPETTQEETYGVTVINKALHRIEDAIRDLDDTLWHMTQQLRDLNRGIKQATTQED